MATLNRFLGDERGADLIEYALIVGLVSIAAATVISPLVPSITSILDKIAAAAGKVKP